MELHVAKLLWLYLQVLMCAGIQQVVEIYLCPGEQQTQISCSTNYKFLKWNISTINQTSIEARNVPYSGGSVTITPVMINSTYFTFSRDSFPGALPLVSIMAIKNITSNLEGTVVSCTGINSSLVASVVLMKAIHIFDIKTDIPNSPEITIMIHFQGSDNFTVTLEWSQFNHETYTVATTPEAVHTSFTTSTSVQLVILYNTWYHVNVTATLCGYSNTTNFTLIQYNYETGVTKYCPQLPITASTTDPVTSMANDDSQAQNQDAATLTIVSSVVVFILSSTLFFFIGCVCGWVGHKHKTKGSDKDITSQAAPDYEDLQPSTLMPQDQEKAFELKENVAYGPIRST